MSISIDSGKWEILFQPVHPFLQPDRFFGIYPVSSPIFLKTLQGIQFLYDQSIHERPGHGSGFLPGCSNSLDLFFYFIPEISFSFYFLVRIKLVKEFFIQFSFFQQADLGDLYLKMFLCSSRIIFIQTKIT